MKNSDQLLLFKSFACELPALASSLITEISRPFEN